LSESYRIFVVEDEALIVMELRDRLETLGYVVCGHAARADAALKSIPEQKPDLVILDVNLGPGPSGIDVAERLQGSYDVPLLYLSAYADDALIARVAKTHPAAYLTKPFDPRLLRAHIQLAIERHAAARRLRESEARFHELFEAGPDAVLTLDENRRVVLANQRAETVFRGPRSEIVGMSIDELLPGSLPEDGSGHSEEEGARTFIRTGRRRDETTFAAEVRVGPLRVGGEGRLIVTLRDVTARLKAEEERRQLDQHLRQTQRMEAMGTLAGGVAHDFNNVLAAILANLELARRDVDGENAGETLESLEAIGAATRRATELVRQILAFSRGEEAPSGVVALHDVVNESAMLLRASLPAGIRLTTTIHPDTPPVLADATLLHQVLMNLGTNAWHAIEGRGEISIRTDGLEIGGMRMARIEVRDDGEGMSPEVRARIFEPFFTTKSVGRGSGLGLSVVHGIVEDHGGSIEVSSTRGEGTEFRVYLPAAVAQHESEIPSRPGLHGGEGNVLYVDDEPALVVALSRLLTYLGYSPTGCVRPTDAIDVVRASPARFDVVITDYHMPELSGLDVGRAIKMIRADLPVILVSGLPRPKEELADHGIDYFLEKPFQLGALDKALRSVARRSGP
jgi:PAS domain S-box-containing protein